MPTDLSSLSNRDVVPVLGIFHGLHAVSMGTVQALLSNIRGLNATWGELRFGPGETYRLFHEHPAVLAFLRQSSLEGIDPSLLCGVDSGWQKGFKLEKFSNECVSKNRDGSRGGK